MPASATTPSHHCLLAIIKELESSAMRAESSYQPAVKALVRSLCCCWRMGSHSPVAPVPFLWLIKVTMVVVNWH
jgi:hypothetical protein